MSGNRKITKEQFSAGTTIDTTRIDKALDDTFHELNEVAQIDGRWMPVNYVAHWSPSRSWIRVEVEGTTNGQMNNRTRVHPLFYPGQLEHSLPFLVCRNWNDEYFPRIRSDVPNTLTHNEWRHKGFIDSKYEILAEQWCRGGDVNYGPTSTDPSTGAPNLAYQNLNFDMTPPAVAAAQPWNSFASQAVYTSAAAPAVTSQIHPMNNKYHAVTFSYYFAEPVILSAINVVAAQEHPISYHASGRTLATGYGMTGFTGLGYKDNVLQAVLFDDSPVKTTDALKHIELVRLPSFNLNQTGAEFWGAHSTAVGGAPLSGDKNPFLSAQVLIDNEFNSENRQLNDIAVNVRSHNQGEQDWFHKVFPTSELGGDSTVGAEYVKMTPTYSGGSTWGIFMNQKNLNIPIPRNSRVRFSIIVKGWLTTQAFEWNSNLTVLEQTQT